jgi:hypothetical protein
MTKGKQCLVEIRKPGDYGTPISAATYHQDTNRTLK